MSSVNNVNFFSGGGMVSLSSGPDAEHKRIMRRLKAYGVTPTGQKTADWNLLHQIELKLAKMENAVSNKFLTVTRAEQEKIQTKKKEKRKENNAELYKDTQKGQKLLGEQIYLAIQMKQEKEKSKSKRKNFS